MKTLTFAVLAIAAGLSAAADARPMHHEHRRSSDAAEQHQLVTTSDLNRQQLAAMESRTAFQVPGAGTAIASTMAPATQR